MALSNNKDVSLEFSKNSKKKCQKIHNHNLYQYIFPKIKNLKIMNFVYISLILNNFKRHIQCSLISH